MGTLQYSARQKKVEFSISICIQFSKLVTKDDLLLAREPNVIIPDRKLLSRTISSTNFLLFLLASEHSCLLDGAGR